MNEVAIVSVVLMALVFIIPAATYLAAEMFFKWLYKRGKCIKLK